MAGLSGTMTFPLGHWLAGAFGRAGSLSGLCRHDLLPDRAAQPLCDAQAEARGGVGRQEDAEGALRAALRRWEFWGIAGIFALIWLDHGILLTYTEFKIPLSFASWCAARMFLSLNV